MTEYDLKIEAVLEDELYTHPPLMPVVVAVIAGTKKDIPRAFRLIKDFPSADLRHLRRIRDAPSGRIECVISKIPNETIDREVFLKHVIEKHSSDNIFEDHRVILVPSKAPKTEQQFETCSKIWPCKYAKCNYLIQCIQGSVFSKQEYLVVKTIVNSLFRHISSSKWVSGAVIFGRAVVYGVGLSDSDTIEQNPSMHSSMIAIDSVAKNAGSGHWICCLKDNNLMCSIQEELDKQEELRCHRLEASFLPYLCTKYDIFITEEPCMMCAMGLVQSRIRRLYYLDTSCLTKFRACHQICYPDKAISKFMVHRDKRLNHRFEAWRIHLQDPA